MMLVDEIINEMKWNGNVFFKVKGNMKKLQIKQVVWNIAGGTFKK